MTTIMMPLQRIIYHLVKKISITATITKITISSILVMGTNMGQGTQERINMKNLIMIMIIPINHLHTQTLITLETQEIKNCKITSMITHMLTPNPQAQTSLELQDSLQYNKNSQLDNLLDNSQNKIISQTNINTIMIKRRGVSKR